MAVPACHLERVRGALSGEAAACIRAARAAAEHTPLQMGPLDGTWLARLCGGMLLWECAFRVVQLATARRRRGAGPGVAPSREDRDLWGQLVPSYAVSTLHALLMCWRGTLHVLQLWRASEAEKMLIVPGGAFYAQNQAVEMSNWAFLTYLCYDMAHVLAVYPRLGGAATVFHHQAFAAAALVAGVTRSFPFAFGWLILCEASTPFLNLRWLFKTLQKREPAALGRCAVALGCRTAAGLEYGIDAVFAATFLGTRVLGYGAGLAQLLHAARRGFFVPLDATARTVMLTLVSMGFALNLLWTKRLLLGLRRSALRAAAAAAEADAARK